MIATVLLIVFMVATIAAFELCMRRAPERPEVVEPQESAATGE